MRIDPGNFPQPGIKMSSRQLDTAHSYLYCFAKNYNFTLKEWFEWYLDLIAFNFAELRMFRFQLEKGWVFALNSKRMTYQFCLPPPCTQTYIFNFSKFHFSLKSFFVWSFGQSQSAIMTIESMKTKLLFKEIEPNKTLALMEEITTGLSIC